MSPTVALLLWLVLLWALLRFDPAKSFEISWAVWVPVVWMFFNQTRLPSQWLGRTTGSLAQAFEEGNPLDRALLFSLILLLLGILAARSFRWGDFFARNIFLTALVFFGLLSVVWSDFPYVAFKRWIRDLGNYLAILVVLSEVQPLEAVRGFFRRMYYVLIPLSILLIKYYPHKSISYGIWSGLPEYTGAATSKNTLGALCMLSGIFFFWDTVMRWSDRKERRTKRILFVNALFITMSFWLLRMSQSATSLVCFIMGCIVIVAYSTWGKRHLTVFKIAIPVLFCAYLILGFGFGLNDGLARSLGRDPSLTGRTNVWQAVLSTNTNPLIGTGYDSFWLGTRLNQVWRLAGPVNHAHNGYLEFYLNFGIIGLSLLAGLLISSYIYVCKNLTHSPSLALLALTLWTLALFNNMTEANFKPSFMCLTFLLGSIAFPERQPSQGPQRFFQSKGLPRADRKIQLPKTRMGVGKPATAEKP